MGQQLIDDNSLIEIIFDVFRRRGYEGTTIAILSQETGLKKSSLYHRFPAGKDDMARAVAEFINAQTREYIIAPLLEKGGSAQERFNSMIDVLGTFYDQGNKNCLFNVFFLDSGNAQVQLLIVETYHSWREALVSLSIEAGASEGVALEKAERFLITLEGALVIQRLSSNQETFIRSLATAKHQFFDQ